MEALTKWFMSFFVQQDESRSVTAINDTERSLQIGSEYQVMPGSFFGHAQNFAVNNASMTAVQGNQYNVQGDRNIVPKIMKFLSQHIIQGAAHDSSARTPPPRCHPNTRVKIIARITTWFEGQELTELLLWITGPAGVGKSAIMQTFAEYLAKSKSLGASVFISRPNGRNNPHGIFITIAYQLATRIEAYCDFIVERLSRDPELLRGDMHAQFEAFIVEPFVEKKIGEGGKRWCILLDGLDELKGDDAQCNIIQLVSAFVHEHPDVPLLWIIASRPESRISNVFDDPAVRHTCRTERVPIDSTEACEDVERFLRSSFNSMQKVFRESVPSDWPSDTDFLKLTAAASGLFAYAEVVMRFIRDPDHADPVSRFEVLLSIIRRSTTDQSSDNPFFHLDALYHAILSPIPLTQWPITKQLLDLLIWHSFIPALIRLDYHFTSPIGMSVLFNLPVHTIFACLAKCRSIVLIPDRGAAHKELTVFHASFTDYLKDPGRSGRFYVGKAEDVWESVMLNILTIWNKCSGDDIATASVESTWHQNCSKLDNRMPSTEVVNLHAELFRGIVGYLARMASSIAERPADSLTYAQLCKVHMAKLCYHFQAGDLPKFVDNLLHLLKIRDIGLTRETQLRELNFRHLDREEMSPANAREEQMGGSLLEPWILQRPRSNAELDIFVSELEYLRKQLPELKVIIFGGVPKWRVAAFRRPAEKELPAVFYVIPYPE